MRWFKKSYDTNVPADVPQKNIDTFIKNHQAITHDTGHLFLFSADQKIEHMNDDFFGPGISPHDNDPKHLFEIAHKGTIGAMATHLGLIARYAKRYSDVNYIVKLNAKTNLIQKEQRDPHSTLLWNVKDVISFQQESALALRGVGYTLYLGSTFEPEMLSQAAHVIFEAHQHGLVAILWMYPRGASITNEKNGHLIAGAAGIAAALGADFAKINPPEPSDGKTSEQWLSIAAQAAGTTKLICSGGTTIDPKLFLEKLYAQLKIGTISGCAIGRNIHQKELGQALAFTKAISALVYKNKNVEQALTLLR